MKANPATYLVVGVGGPEERVDGGIRLELALLAVHVLVSSHGLFGQMLEDPIWDAMAPVIGQHVIPLQKQFKLLIGRLGFSNEIVSFVFLKAFDRWKNCQNFINFNGFL